MRLYESVLLIIIFILYIFSPQIQAQSLDTQQDPKGIKWKEIHTDHYKIVFPDKIEQDAQRVASTLQYQFDAINKTMLYDAKPITLLLTTEGVITNGYVAMAPRRSEWYGTPITIGADDGDWYNLLAVHEIRHVVQFDKIMNRGIIKGLGFAFGQSLPYVLSSVLVPTWFYEGDAVLMETALTRTGRGRDPSFNVGIRSLELAQIHYSYSKAYLGSYKNYYPDYYSLGYLLVTHIRRINEADAWAKILGRTAWFPFYPFAFSGSAAGIIDRRVAGIYDDTMAELKKMWRHQQDSLSFTPVKILNPDRKVYTNYNYPQETKDGSVIVLKSGLDDTQRLVLISKNGKEKKLKEIFAMSTFSYAADKITWNQLSLDPRWSKRSYSDIVVYDLKKNKTNKITSNGKYFTPALSPDGQSIAAIENSADRKSTLVILDAQSGKILQRVPNPRNETLRQPSWSEDGKAIVFTNQYTEGKALSIYYPEEEYIKEVIPHCWQGIMDHIFYGNYILFNSFFSGIDNIYAVDIETGQTYQVTSRPLGAYSPSVSYDGRSLLFNDYTINGKDAVKTTLNKDEWVRTELIGDHSINYFEPVIKQEQGGDIYSIDKIPTTKFKVNDYSLLKNALNFHSWSLVVDSLNPGFTVFSNDVMNTTAAGLGIFYNTNEHEPGAELSLSYAGMYPIIDTYLAKLNRTTFYKFTNGDETEDTWSETSATIGLRLPLTFINGIYQRQITLSAYIQSTKISGQDIQDLYDLGNGVFYPVWYQLSLAQVKQYLQKDIKPQFAQVFNFLYRHTPIKGNFRGSQFAAEAVLFFPGLLKHHSLWLKGNYEEQKVVNYRFTSVLDFPRGYHYNYFDNFYLGSVNYGLPLVYPDFNIGGYFYLKRIKTNLFYDYGIGKTDGNKVKYESGGFELLFDHHWFLLPIELEIGWRFSYKLKERSGFSEFVFQLPLY